MGGIAFCVCIPSIRQRPAMPAKAARQCFCRDPGKSVALDVAVGNRFWTRLDAPEDDAAPGRMAYFSR